MTTLRRPYKSPYKTGAAWLVPVAALAGCRVGLGDDGTVRDGAGGTYLATPRKDVENLTDPGQVDIPA